MTISSDPNLNEASFVSPAAHAEASVRTACVYCGSSHGADPLYAEVAEDLGQAMVRNGIRLVYGGGRVGLMGVVADAVMNAGGEAIGIIPQHIHDLEPQHHGLSELIVVDNMHTRKKMMADRSQAFVILPGGFGTLDECFEIITWKHLKLHDHPVIFVNVNGYWDPLLEVIEHMAESGFVRDTYKRLFTVATTVEDVIAQLLAAPEPEPTPRPDIR